jgi:uncharacterized protein (TIGR00730 family)
MSISPKPMSSVGVFCGASNGNHPRYRAAAEDLGRALVARGCRLVYGAGSIGLMGTVARSVTQFGGSVLGIIPYALTNKELAGETIGEVIHVDTMSQRKALMAKESDAFVALPGGFGTMDELFEMITWSQVGIHRKSIGLYNVDGFFDPILTWVDHAVKEGFIRPPHREIFVVANDPALLLETMARHVPPVGLTTWEGVDDWSNS